MTHLSTNLRLLLGIEVLFITLAVTQRPLLSFADPATISGSIQDRGIEKELEQYIRNHPEVILESVQAFESGVKKKRNNA